MITNIDHLGLAIHDRRKAIDFFENVLGTARSTASLRIRPAA